MTVEVIIVLVALVGMLAALIMDKMRRSSSCFSVPESLPQKKCWKVLATRE